MVCYCILCDFMGICDDEDEDDDDDLDDFDKFDLINIDDYIR